MRTARSLVAAVITAGTAFPAYLSAQDAQAPKSPLVLVVGCAQPGSKAGVWQLTNASARTVTNNPGITAQEEPELKERRPGSDRYELVGVGEFTTVEEARQIGDRGALIPANRANTTALLGKGKKVAVKGLFVATPTPRINLTSVVTLGTTCP